MRTKNIYEVRMSYGNFGDADYLHEISEIRAKDSWEAKDTALIVAEHKGFNVGDKKAYVTVHLKKVVDSDGLVYNLAKGYEENHLVICHGLLN